MSNENREQQMMAAAEAYVEESEEIYNIVGAITDFCAGWRAADQHPNWKLVKDELPAVGEMVQIYVQDLDDVVYAALQLTGDWWCEEYGCNFSNIQHWMRKPVPPRKEGFMIATCIKTDPLQTLEVGKDYEIEQYKDKFIVKWAGMVISKEVFNEHFKVKGGQDD